MMNCLAASACASADLAARRHPERRNDGDAFLRFDQRNLRVEQVDDGSDLHLVASGEGTQYLRVPTISPDGSTVAYWCGPGVMQSVHGLPT